MGKRQVGEASGKVKIGLIGDSIPGLVEECLCVADGPTAWQVTKLKPDSVRGHRIRNCASWVKAFCKMAFVDIVIVIYVDKRAPLAAHVAHFLRKTVVFYWLGTDVLFLKTGVMEGKKFNCADIHLSYSEGNIAELKDCGIVAEEIFLPTGLSERIALMPANHSVLLSLPDSRKEFYGYCDLMRLADDFPDLEFHVVRTEHPEFYDKPNVVVDGILSRDEMDDLFDRVSICVRWLEHDGTSLILMESALKGKYIISKNPFPCGVITTTYEGLCSSLRDVLAAPLEPREDFHDYALEHFTQRCAGNKLSTILRELVNE